MEMEVVLRWYFISIFIYVPNRLLVVGSMDGLWSQQVGMCIAKNRRLNDLIYFREVKRLPRWWSSCGGIISLLTVYHTWIRSHIIELHVISRQLNTRGYKGGSGSYDRYDDCEQEKRNDK